MVLFTEMPLTLNYFIIINFSFWVGVGLGPVINGYVLVFLHALKFPVKYLSNKKKSFE